ncbi:hypothetical protein PIB30_000354 [Stylosanthes scabra]|uniref:Uncharacterized protein n=1 Tax=Stylosanthes scabra TaxID=79078 RepID=A0ABU6U332_9FABA|nr:hypothetical protein [Stylosanthes scabra]
MIKGERHYEVVKKQFRSMRSGKEIDSAEDFQKFRKEMIWKIILSKDNLYIQKEIDGAIAKTIHRPSAALQSPYVQVSTGDLKS